MKFDWITQDLKDITCDALLIMTPKNEAETSPFVLQLDKALNARLLSLLSEQPEKKNYGTVTSIYTLGKIKAKQILLVGRGLTEPTVEGWRGLFGMAARAAKKETAKEITILLPQDSDVSPGQLLALAVEGVVLGEYSFDGYKTKKDSSSIELCNFIGMDAPSDYMALIEKSLNVAENVNLVRDLVSQPASVLTPSAMEREAKTIAKQYGLTIEVLGRKQMQAQNMNALLAVAQGSTEKPKLITLEYKGDPSSSETVALIGKGITFDSGGISIKPSAGMEEMKDDMAGAATVLGTIKSIAQLKPKINVLALLPCTENMPSGTAYRPGDIITAMSGTTIEVVNTDAEGRLILADAITYAREKGATKLVDLATLTGACVIALGSVASGVFTNNKEWCQKLLAAAEQSGEKMWQLPLYTEYREQIKSSIADIKNSGGREAGASTAACFLAEFAGDTPWLHIDIAGTVTTKKDKGYAVAGATGVGVFTLVEMLQALSNE